MSQWRVLHLVVEGADEKECGGFSARSKGYRPSRQELRKRGSKAFTLNAKGLAHVKVKLMCKENDTYTESMCAQ